MWEKLSVRELEQIYQCKDFRELHELFDSETYASLLDQAGINHNAKLRRIYNKNCALSQSIQAAVIPFDCWLMLFGLFEAGALVTFAIPIVVIITPIIGMYFYNRTQQENQRESEQLLNFFQLSNLKLKVLDQLMMREITKTNHSDALISNQRNRGGYVANNNVFLAEKKLSYKKSILFGSATTITIGSSYLFGVTTLYEILGFATLTSALIGPVGLAVGLTVTILALGLGVYLGYKHYQAEQTKHAIELEMQRTLTKIENAHSQLEFYRGVNLAAECAEPIQSKSPAPFFKARANETNKLESKKDKTPSTLVLFPNKSIAANLKKYGKAPQDHQALYTWWMNISRLGICSIRPAVLHSLDQSIKQFSDSVLIDVEAAFEEILSEIKFCRKALIYDQRLSAIDCLQSYIESEIAFIQNAHENNPDYFIHALKKEIYPSYAKM